MCILTIPPTHFPPQRCRHKETSGEAREAADRLLKELLACVSLPLCVAAGQAVTALVQRARKDLSDLLNPSTSPSLLAAAGGTGDGKTDMSYVNFLVDILGGLGAAVRLVMVEATEEAASSEGCFLPTAVVGVLQRQYKCILDRASVDARRGGSGAAVDMGTDVEINTDTDTTKKVKGKKKGKGGRGGGHKQGGKTGAKTAQGGATSAPPTTSRLSTSYFNVHSTLRWYAILAGTALDVMLGNDWPISGSDIDTYAASDSTHQEECPRGDVSVPSEKCGVVNTDCVSAEAGGSTPCSKDDMDAILQPHPQQEESAPASVPALTRSQSSPAAMTAPPSTPPSTQTHTQSIAESKDKPPQAVKNEEMEPLGGQDGRTSPALPTEVLLQGTKHVSIPPLSTLLAQCGAAPKDVTRWVGRGVWCDMMVVICDWDVVICIAIVTIFYNMLDTLNITM